MGVVLGELLLEMGLDLERYDAQMIEAHARAVEFAQRMQSVMGKVKIDAPKFDDSLNLTPTVDDSALTDLNKHLSRKQKHFMEVQRYFDAQPLTVRVDDSSLDRLEQRLGAIESGEIKIRVDTRELETLQFKQMQIAPNPQEASRDRGIRVVDNTTESIKRAMDQTVKNYRYRVQFDEQTGNFRFSEGPRRGQFAKAPDADGMAGIPEATRQEYRRSPGRPPKKSLFQEDDYAVAMFERVGDRISKGMAKDISQSIGDGLRGAIGLKDFSEKFQKEVSQSVSKGIKDANKKNIFQKAAAGFTDIFGDFFTGYKEEVGASFARRVAEGMIDELESSFNLSFKQIGKSQSQNLSPLVKGLLGKREDIQKFTGAMSKSIGDRLAAAGFKLGDGIIAGIDAFGDGQGRFEAIQTGIDSIDFSNWKDGISDMKTEMMDAVKEFRFALSNGEGFEIPFVGDMIRAHHMRGIEQRGIPYAMQRAGEINAQRRAKNSGKIVDEDTRELVIAVGGYAGREAGTSGARISKAVNDLEIPGTQGIFVKNRDIDITKFNNPWANAGFAQAKPNLRGFSPDAMEMVAQALVALQKNPEIKIKFVGESGGGFLAEEAYMAMGLLGLGDKAEYLGVGTPNLIGGLDKNPKPNRGKIISQDEKLGHKIADLYRPYGLANMARPEQDIPGVTVHPIEGYWGKDNPQLLDFYMGHTPYGVQGRMGTKPEDMAKYRSAAERQLESSLKDPLNDPESRKTMADNAQAALSNWSMMKQLAMRATGDLADELEEIASMFEMAYVRLAPENDSMSTVRTRLKQLREKLEEVQANPGLEKSEDINSALGTLNILKRATTPTERLTGTRKKKVDDLRAQVKELEDAYSQPSLLLPNVPGIQIPAQVKEEKLSVPVERYERFERPLPGPLIASDVNTEMVEAGRAAGVAFVEMVEAGLQQALAAINPADIPALPALGGLELDNIKGKLQGLREATQKAGNLLRGRPAESEGYLQVVQNLIPKLEEQIQSSLDAIPTDQRMGEGAKLANAKSQLAKIENKVDGLVRYLQEMKDAQIIDAQVVDNVVDTINQEPPRQLGIDFDAVPAQSDKLKGYLETIDRVGKEFFQQQKAAKELMGSGNPQDQERAQAIAKELLEIEGRYRDILEELEAHLSLAGERPEEVTKKISTARGRITRGVKGAESIVKETESLGINVGSAYNEGLESTLQEASSAAGQLARATIDELKSVLGIQSPSKVGIYIGQMVGKGIQIGIQKSIEDITTVVNNGVLPAFASIGKMTQANALESSTQKAIARARELEKELEPIRAVNNAVAIGGFAGKGGTTSKPVGDRIQTMLGNDFNVDAVDNIASDTVTDYSQKLRFVADIVVKALTMEIVRGFNPDAIEAAAVAIARKNQTGVDTDFIGYSAGGYVARQAQKISQNAGVDSRGVGLGTPMFGMFGTDPNRFRAYMGETDMLSGLASRFGGRREASQRFVGAGDRHILGNYLSSGVVQDDMSGFLGKTLPGVGIGDPSMFAGADLEPFGKAMGQGLAEGMKSSVKTIDVAAEQLTYTIVERIKDNLEIASPSGVGIWIGEMVNKGIEVGLKTKIKVQDYAKTLQAKAGSGINNFMNEAYEKFLPEPEPQRNIDIPTPIIGEFVSSAVEGLMNFFDEAKKVVTFLPEVAKGVGRVGETLVKHRKLVVGAATAYGTFAFALLPALQYLSQFQDQAFQVAAELETLERTISFTSSSRSQGQDNVDFVRQISRDNRTNLQQGLAGFAGISASTRGTNLEGESSRQLFEAMTQAGAAYSLDEGRQERAFTAITQSIDKQVISMEELRGQLSEALPGSMAIAARSMNMGVKEFQDFVASGELLAEEFIPRFAQQLSAETSIGLAGSADTAQAAMNNLNNATTEALEAFGKTTMPWKKLGLNTLANMLYLVVENIDLLVKVATTGLLMVYGKAIIQTLQLAAAMIKAAVGTNTATASMAGFGKMISGALPMMAKVAGTFVAVTAAMDTFSIISKAFGDNSNGIREFADQSIKALENYLEVVEKINATNIESGQSKTQKGDIRGYLEEAAGGRSILEDTFFGGILGKTGSRVLERGLQDLFGFSSTFEDLISSQTDIAVSDLAASAGELQSQIMSQYLGASGEGIGALAEVQQTDIQLDELRARRRGLDPEDEAGRLDLSAQIDQLEALRRVQAEPLQAAQGAIAQNIESLKAARSALEDELNRPGVSDTRKVELQNQVNLLASDIESAEKTANQFNNILRQTEDVVRNLAIEFQHMTTSLEEANMQAEKMTTQSRGELFQAVITSGGGLGEGQRTSIENQIQLEELQTRLSNTEQAIANQLTQLQGSDIRSALDATGFEGQDIQNISRADLEARIASVYSDQDESREKRLLEQAAVQLGEFQSLQVEAERLGSEALQVQAEAVTRLRDAAISVRDFYEGIQRNAEQLQIEATASQLSLDTQRQQNKLKEALVGFQGSFIDDTVDSLISLLDTLQQPIQEALRADQEILNLRNEFTDTTRQAQELERSLPQEFLQGRTPSQQDLSAYMPPGFGAGPEDATRTDPFSSGTVGMPQIINQGQLGTNGSQPSTDTSSLPQFGNQDIQHGMQLAERSLETQLRLTEERRDAAQETARIEAGLQIESLANQFERARDEMEEMGSGFEDSFESIRRNLGDRTPFRDLEDSLMDIRDGFEDTAEGIEDFQERLRSTISVAQSQIQIIQNMVASGEMSQAVADSILPGIRETIVAAESQLANSNQLIQENERLLEEQRRDAIEKFQREEANRRFGARQRIVGGRIEGAQGRAELLSRTGDTAGAARLNAIASVAQQQIDFEAQSRELDELLRTGEITNSEFYLMKDNLESLNQISLAGIEQEFQDAMRTAGDRVFEVKRRLNDLDTQIVQGLSQSSKFRGDFRSAAIFDAEARGLQQVAAYEQQKKELNDLRATGQITGEEFTRMKGKIEELNQITLQNLRDEITSIDPSTAFSGLSSDGPVDTGAAVEKLRRNLSDAGNIFTREQRGQISQAISALDSTSGKSAGAAARSLRGVQNPFLDQALQQGGRGDVVSLLQIARQNDAAPEALAALDATVMGSGMSGAAQDIMSGIDGSALLQDISGSVAAIAGMSAYEGADYSNRETLPADYSGKMRVPEVGRTEANQTRELGASINKLADAVNRMGRSPQSINVYGSPDPGGDATGILFDLARQKARSGGV